jgi:hypothetical protein
MNQQAAAIVIAGALIAGAIMLTNHWSFHQGAGASFNVRLNRWTGAVETCLDLPGPERKQDCGGSRSSHSQ